MPWIRVTQQVMDLLNSAARGSFTSGAVRIERHDPASHRDGFDWKVRVDEKVYAKLIQIDPDPSAAIVKLFERRALDGTKPQ